MLPPLVISSSLTNGGGGSRKGGGRRGTDGEVEEEEGEGAKLECLESERDCLGFYLISCYQDLVSV